MFNSSDSMNNTYFNLQKRTFDSLKASATDEQIVELVQSAYENFMKSENIVLTRGEKQRLFNQVFRMLLEDVLNRSDDAQSI